MTPSERIRRIAYVAGWTDNDLAAILLDAIDDGPSCAKDLVQWCQRVAEDENTE